MNAQTRTLTALAPAAMVALGAAAPALAGPFDPIFRGEPNSVHAVFEWTGSTEWTNPVFDTGPSDYPMADLAPIASDDGLNTTIELPNFIDPLPFKDMIIQMAFDGSVPVNDINIVVNGYDPLDVEVMETGRDSADPDLFWAAVEFRLLPNPDWEQIFIFGDTGMNIVPGNLLIIEIDTISFPAPGAVCVAGVAGLGVLRRRRR